jgi:hypothetical protein
VTRQYPVDSALAIRMRDPAFAHAYDVWLLVLTQQAAEIDLARSGLQHQRPRGARARTESSQKKKTIPRTA